MSAFPVVYCVTLRDHSWRGRFAKNQFDALGLQVRWVYGYNGVTLCLLPGTYHDVKTGNSLEYMSPWAVGIVLSHIAALGCAVSDGHEEFVIVEDDVDFTAESIGRWPVIRSSFPAGLQIVHLEYCCDSDKVSEPINEHLQRCYYPQCAAAIWWRRDAAEFALTALRPIHSPYDIMLAVRVLPYLSHAITIPKFATQKTSAGKWSKS